MPDTATERICVNTICRSDDPNAFCPDCGRHYTQFCEIDDPAMVGTFCVRCGHELVRFDAEIISRAAIKAMDVPIGEIIDFSKCFDFNKEN